MIRSAVLALAGVSFLVIGTSAFADVHPIPLTGREFSAALKTCRDAKVSVAQIADWRACSGYLTGAINGAIATSSILGQPPIFCLPEGETDRMIQDKLIAYIDGDQTVQKASSIATILAGMTSLYPCPVEAGQTPPTAIPATK